jgi:arginyl-tRNA--protein-N-Asp/Glu arginylyltransferase
MAYKAGFKPSEMLLNGHWQRVEDRQETPSTP